MVQQHIIRESIVLNFTTDISIIYATTTFLEQLTTRIPEHYYYQTSYISIAKRYLIFE